MGYYASTNTRRAVRARKDNRFAVSVLLLHALAFVAAGVWACAAGAVTVGVISVCVAFVLASAVAIYGS